MPDPLAAVRVVSTPGALDAVAFPPEAIVLRTAPDEALVLGVGAGLVVGAVAVEDPHAIVVDDAGWCGRWLDAADGEAFLRRSCGWRRPAERPAFAQGMVAGLPVKLWLETDRTLFVVPHVFAHDLDERMAS